MFSFRMQTLSFLFWFLLSHSAHAALCEDCCLVTGEPDGQYSNGTYYKDIGGLRQTQRLANSGGGCSGGCYSSLEAATSLMYSCAEKQLAYCESKGSVTPCLNLPEKVKNNQLLFETAYGHADACKRGGFYYYTTAYWLEKSVVCIDDSIDSDSDGVFDCDDACPFEFGNADDGCNYQKLALGRDEKDPDLMCKGKVSEQGNPTSIYSGNKIEAQADFAAASPFMGGLRFERFYNSQSEDISPLGYGWTHNYNITLEQIDGINIGGQKLVVTDETGFGRYFQINSTTGEISSLFAERTHLEVEAGHFIWQRNDGTAYTFDRTTHRLLFIDDPFGNRQTLSYDDEGRLVTVVDSASSRALTFAYENALLAAIHLTVGGIDAGAQVRFDHDTNGNLTSVVYADGSGFVYEYDDRDNDPSQIPYINNLTRKTNTAGHLLSTWSYDAADRCISNESPDGNGVTIDYEAIPDGVVVTDAYGISKTYHLTTIRGINRIATITGESGCATCIDEPIRFEYDDKLNVTEIEYANGRIDRFTDFNDHGNPETHILASGRVDERTITFTWHPFLAHPLTRTEASVLGNGNRVTTWDFDDDGDDIANEVPTETLTRVITSGYTVNASGATVPVESIIRYAYNDNGQLIRVDGPLAGTEDSTTYTYDSVTGDLIGVSRPLSGDTTFSDYDLMGKPGLVTDANQNSIAYTYDGRGRPLTVTRQWDNAAVDYRYTLAGKLESISLPNGVHYGYGYDDEYGRLVRVTDAKGNTVNEVYDDQGNIIEMAYLDPLKETTFWQGFDYHNPENPGKLWKAINPDSTDNVYAYDAMGNLSQIIDPKNRITRFGYDLFNRTISKEQPGSVSTNYTYDIHDNLVLVTDPENHTTEYVIDDFGRRIMLISPDSGTAHYTYDAAGNLLTKRNANGISSSYEYDNEYRLTAIRYPDASEDVLFFYDQGDNGKGRLTGMVDQSGSYVYGWDAAGNRIVEQKTIDGTTFTTRFAYDAAGLMTGMTYPDGLEVDWVRDTTGQIEQVTATRDGSITILADGITHLPFGPTASMVLGNGISVLREFDLQYRMIANFAGGVQDYDYVRDEIGNVTAATNAFDASRNQHFAYDDIDRLVEANGSYGKIAYTYDNVGNRLSRSLDGLIENYTYTADTNRLSEIVSTSVSQPNETSGRDVGSGLNAKPYSSRFGYGKHDNRRLHAPQRHHAKNTQTPDTITAISSDDAGNIVKYGDRQFVYNQANRLRAVIEGGKTLAEYVYSADAKRVKKVVGGEETVYHYDSEGRLIAESDRNGEIQRSYVYQDGAPLALFVKQNHGRSPSSFQHRFLKNLFIRYFNRLHKLREEKRDPHNIYYYHADQLGTPQKMTDSKGRSAWDATYSPFGNVIINDEEAQNNLRFAGQYFDRETGLHYNDHRYYDPATGRYLTADPIGLAGGINPFVYASGNPVNFADPLGLMEDSIRSQKGFFDRQLDSVSTRYNQLTHPEVWGPDQGQKNFMFMVDMATIAMSFRVESLAKMCLSNASKYETLVIGRLETLTNLRKGEQSLLDRLSDLGSHKLNWKQNSSVLRQEISKGRPIRDASPGDMAGKWLNAERNILTDHGWTFDPQTNYWMPPIQ